MRCANAAAAVCLHPSPQAFAAPERVAELVGRVREALQGALPAAVAKVRLGDGRSAGCIGPLASHRVGAARRPHHLPARSVPAPLQMRLYLPSPSTHAILFKPIKSNVAEAHGQV